MYVTVRPPMHVDASDDGYDCENLLDVWVPRGSAPEVPAQCMCGLRFDAKQRDKIERRAMAKLEERFGTRRLDQW